MKYRLSSLALRKTRTHLQQRVVLLALIGVILILGLSGPFGTFEALPMLARTMYWAITVVATYSIGLTCVVVGTMALPAKWPALLTDALSGLFAGVPVALTVTLINLAWFADYTVFGDNLLRSSAILLVYCVLIAGTVAVLIGQMGGFEKATEPSSPQIPLLDRLPFEKRAALVSLQAQDHYVMVTTTKGKELVFMRISDAVKEVGTTKGLQTHRSFWVAQDQIIAGKQLGERGTLTTSTQDEIPVSRNKMKQVKALGFI